MDKSYEDMTHEERIKYWDDKREEEKIKRAKVRHLKTNSYIGSNRMSPTLQPIPIEIFSNGVTSDIDK